MYQHIKMISKGSCETEDWSNGCWKFSFVTTGINYILKYIKNRKLLFDIVIVFYNITVFTVSNKCNLGAQIRDFFQKH